MCIYHLIYHGNTIGMTAMLYIHETNHCHLQPSNVFISFDQQWNNVKHVPPNGRPCNATSNTNTQPTHQPISLIPWSTSWSCWLICSKRSPVSHFFASVGYGPWIWNWRTPKWPEWPACFDIRLDHTINLSNKQVLDRTFCQKYLSFECVSKILQMD